jgi:DNA mismatch endonuclease, patch repair protein
MQTVRLERDGWIILRFWEHEVACDLQRIAAEVIRVVRGGRLGRRREISWVVKAVEPLASTGKLERRYLQDLRNPDRVRVEERERTTRKW